MQEAVRLENLGTALLGEGPSHPERQQLLAGYLELKREVTVELLAACCEKASQEELERVSSACFLLGDAACWELKRPRWLDMEFELLRQAALAAQRPGHLLLIQSLERACRGIARRVEPYLDSAALYRWTQCALDALWSKDVQALRSRLPALLQASDERVLHALTPTCEAHGVASLLDAPRQATEMASVAYPTLAQGPEVSESAEGLLSASQVAAASEPIEVLLTAPQGAALNESTEVILTAPQAPGDSESAQASLTSAQATEVGQPAPEPMAARESGALCTNWSGGHTSWREVPQRGAPPPVPAAAAPGSTSCTGVLWPRSTQEGSEPWPTQGRTPGFT
jgi:hypothetical protein